MIVLLKKTFWHHFQKGINQIEDYPWHLIYFGWKKSGPNPNYKRISNELVVPFNNIRGAYGYALHKRMFPFLKKHCLYNGMEIDVFFEFCIMKKPTSS